MRTEDTGCSVVIGYRIATDTTESPRMLFSSQQCGLVLLHRGRTRLQALVEWEPKNLLLKIFFYIYMSNEMSQSDLHPVSVLKPLETVKTCTIQTLIQRLWNHLCYFSKNMYQTDISSLELEQKQRRVIWHPLVRAPHSHQGWSLGGCLCRLSSHFVEASHFQFCCYLDCVAVLSSLHSIILMFACKRLSLKISSGKVTECPVGDN